MGPRALELVRPTLKMNQKARGKVRKDSISKKTRTKSNYLNPVRFLDGMVLTRRVHKFTKGKK